MPRQRRQDAPGRTYHVTARGVNRRPIFLEDEERRQFLARLDTVLRWSGARCYAWALMPNHAHLLLRRGEATLGETLHRLLLMHAMRFNEAHARVGHLFQNRAWTHEVESDEEFLVQVRYIHGNPFRAGIVSSLDELAEYPWTGHSALLGNHPAPFQDTGYVLRQFGHEELEARRRLRAFMRAGLKSPRGRPAPRTLKDLLDDACWATWSRPEDVLAGAVDHATARGRALFAYLATTKFGRSQRGIARWLEAPQSTINRAARRGAELARRLRHRLHAELRDG
jgi:REP element-mobilizing transposase RayT